MAKENSVRSELFLTLPFTFPASKVFPPFLAAVS